MWTYEVQRYIIMNDSDENGGGGYSDGFARMSTKKPDGVNVYLMIGRSPRDPLDGFVGWSMVIYLAITVMDCHFFSLLNVCQFS